MDTSTNNFNDRRDKSSCSGLELRRNPNNHQMTQQIIENGNQNVANILPNPQVPTTNPLLSYQGSSFGGLYSSPGFNSSLTSYENNMQWLTDGRVQNQHNQISGNFTSDKNANAHSLPPTTSHSCCVNRFGDRLDSLAIGSPLPSEQMKSACDITSFQNKSNLSMNIIDPIQSWLNLQMPNNQQYCKYGERSLTQNYNTPVSISSQINLPIIDQSDLKQSDLCIQSPDSCFKNIANTNIKNVDNGVNGLKQNQYLVEKKQSMSHENNTIFKQQGSYQSSIMQKDWKSTFQSMQNYITSPNMFNGVSDSQENYIFSQYSMPNSFYSSESYAPYVSVNKNNTSYTTHIKPHNHNSSSVQNVFIEQNNSKSAIINNSKLFNNDNGQYISKPVGDHSSTVISQGNVRPNSFSGTSMSDCCQVKETQLNAIGIVDHNAFGLKKTTQEKNKCIVNQTSSVSLNIDTGNQNNKTSFKSPEGISSESEESNIIVEESDDIGEIESEISIEEIKKTYKTNETCSGEVMLKCLICNVTTSSQTPANHFVHMNDSFPVTSTRTPVRTKLEQSLPMDMLHLFNYLKAANSFLCRRCLNLIETVDLLEVKLTSAKQTINDQFSKTVQLLMPEIEQLLQEESNVSESVCTDEQARGCVELEKPDKNDNTEEVVIASDTENANEFQCSYCLKTLSSQKTYNLHLQQHNNVFNFYCERCGKGYSLKPDLERHVNWHNGVATNKQMLCEMCGDIFSSKDLLHSHQIKSHERNYSFQCETCGKGFTRKDSLEIHSFKHSGTRLFVCEYCGQTLTSGSSLKSHIKICTKDLPHKCDKCDKSFASKGLLGKHESQHTGVFKLMCSVCAKGFNKPADLKYHMLSHSDEKQYKCAECDKAFKTMFNLNYHTRIVHKKENVFTCSVCGQVFGQQTLLSDHMNSHTKEKPYNCAQCGKSFVYQNALISHLKSHEGKVKTKTCTECGKAIKTRMSVHMRSHTGEKPYKCTYCPLAFSVGTSLKKHIKSKHSNRPM